MRKASFSCFFVLSVFLLVSCSGPYPEEEALLPSLETPAAPLSSTVRREPLHSERHGIGVQSSARQAMAQAALVTVDVRRSLVVTEQAILQNFTLKEVMDQLVAQSGVPGLTSIQLFRQLWDTQNPGPGLGLGGHCNDQVDANGRPVFNTYPYHCRAAEGSQAQADPFTNPSSGQAYKAVGLFNRFDLAPASGADCGEYRIVFAKRSGELNALSRNFIIFEATLPNPRPNLGLEGCLPIARFWQHLSTDADLASRTAALKGFYFQGLPGFLPVVHLHNYGADVTRGTGQIRTNMFMQFNWLLREFKLQQTCGATGCTALKAVIATDKVNPFGGLFNPASTHPLAADFRAFFPTQVSALANPDINLFTYEVPARFNAAQSDSQGLENDYVFQFGAGGALRSAIQAELTRIGSTLTPEHIIRRARALSCAGCHELSNGDNVGTAQPWPSSLVFTHTSEFTESGPEGARFQLSPALVNVFLPHRKRVLEEFLNRPRICREDCLASGASHSLALRPDGTVWAAGENSSGQLGDGSAFSRNTPVQAVGVSSAVAVSAGTAHSLALLSNGTVWSWGFNAYGQLGNGTTTNRSTPAQVPGLSRIVAVAAGRYHSLALRSDGTVWAWGANYSGQLGDATTINRSTPALVPGPTGVVAISAFDHSLALRFDGTVWAWGANSSGQLGNGTMTSRSTAAPIAALSGVTSVAAGSVSLAARSDGTVWAWGSTFTLQQQEGGWSGRLQLTPGPVAGLSGVVTVAAAGHALALRSDGTVWAWGQNDAGQLGEGSRLGSAAPVQVLGLAGVTDIAAGACSLALRSDGSVWAWGNNFSGQRGDGTTANRTMPVRVSGLTSFSATDAGASHALALKSDGTVWGWGYNTWGQLGDGTRLSRSQPLQVPNLSGAVAVSAGGYHSLALRSGGSVWAWGQNASGQLGDGSVSNRYIPFQVPGLSAITAISAGNAHSLAIGFYGVVWAWGSNSSGQLGNGSTVSRSTPAQVPGLVNIRAISAGVSHSLAVSSSGAVWAWGANGQGQLGDGTTTSRTSPVLVPGLTSISAVAAGQFHSLALRSDGTVWAWGMNHVGELGDGSTVQRPTPFQVPGLSSIVAVAAGTRLSLAVRSDGTIWAWGSNIYGELGTGSPSGMSRVPVNISSMSRGMTVAAGASEYSGHSFALAMRADGTVWAWGSSSDGQIGDGGPTWYAVTPSRSLLR